MRFSLEQMAEDELVVCGKKLQIQIQLELLFVADEIYYVQNLDSET